MTVIVAARTIHRVGRRRSEVQEAVTIASDTQLTDGWEKASGAYPKIWKDDGHFLFGAAGMVAAWQSVKHNVTWPHYPETQDWEEWLVRQVKPEVTHALDCAGLLYRKKGMIDMGMSLVIASGINLASLDCLGGVIVPRSHCVAIGSGYAQALGSLGNGPWTSEQVIRAAFAATQTDLGCGPPIYWASTLDYEINEADLSVLS